MKILIISIITLIFISGCSFKVENNYYDKDGKKIEKGNYEK
jgi:uncharacterized protein YceK